MFNIEGFLTCKSELPDELQTPQPNRTIPDLQPYESPTQHYGVAKGHTQKHSCNEKFYYLISRHSFGRKNQILNPLLFGAIN